MKFIFYLLSKKTNQHFLILIVFFLLILVSCKNKSESTSPEILPFDKIVEHQISFLEIPIAFNVEQIEDKINQAIKGTLYADQSFENKQQDGLKIRVRKVENIQISVKDNFMYYSVPLHIWASKRVLKTKIFGKKIEKSKELDFSLRIKLRSEIKLNSHINDTNIPGFRIDNLWKRLCGKSEIQASSHGCYSDFFSKINLRID